MTLICFASQKGSPGTTATTLAVAAALKLAPGRRKLLLEADTTGGTLAIRYRLPTEPGLLTLAAAVRSGMESDEIWRHAQELPGGLPVIVCPDGPEQVNAAMAASGAQLGRFLAGLRDVDVLCDVGRLAPSSPALDFVAEASALLMVSRPTAEQLQPAARRMMMLRPHVQNLGWVLIGQKPYGPLDVEQTFKFPVVGVIADDARSVTSLENGVVTKRLRRHPFIRSSSTLAGTLSDWLAPLTAVQPAADGQEGPPQAAPVPEPATLDLASAPPPGQPSRNGAQSAGPDADGPAGRPPEGFRGTADAPPMPDGTGHPPVDVPPMPDGTGGTQVDVPPMPDGAGRPPADVPPMPPVEPPDADVAAMPPPELSEADVSMAPPSRPGPGS